ncbi:hypothetical protein JHK87_050294 [Glycine soja]|nr:hypothetical protein JHK87_050294 [Glycine soja]
MEDLRLLEEGMDKAAKVVRERKILVALTGEKGKFDELLEDKGVNILIDPKALMNVIGTKMDFVDDKLRFRVCQPSLISWSVLMLSSLTLFSHAVFHIVLVIEGDQWSTVDAQWAQLIGLIRSLEFLSFAILASVILSALPGLIDLSEAYKIWKVDKIDFLACAGAFFGVLFASVEIGLLAAAFLPIDLVNIDTAGITALEELHKSLSSHGKQGTQRFLQRLELYASVVMGLEAPALVNGQNLAITYNVFLGNHTPFYDALSTSFLPDAS